MYTYFKLNSQRRMVLFFPGLLSSSLLLLSLLSLLSIRIRIQFKRNDSNDNWAVVAVVVAGVDAAVVVRNWSPYH